MPTPHKCLSGWVAYQITSPGHRRLLNVFIVRKLNNWIRGMMEISGLIISILLRFDDVDTADG